MSKNYREGKLPPLQDTYEGFAFSFLRPDYDSEGNKVGHRIIPDDDTPRTFINCNLVNACPPPGSTLINCNTTITRIERRVANLDNGPEKRLVESDLYDVIYGRTNPETLVSEYKDTPLEIPSKVHG